MQSESVSRGPEGQLGMKSRALAELPHGSSQPVTPGAGDPMPFSGLGRHCTHVVHIYTC